ncbi:MAG: hypothetical protein WA958_18875 [Tunicatimonas sp.]
MDQEVTERVGTLEIILGEFVVRTEKMLRRMEQDTKILKEEMSDFKEEMSDFKEEMRQDRKDLNKKWGELANRLGTIAEDIAAPNVRTLATTLFGCTDIDGYSVRVMRRNRKDRKRLTEFDVLITCGNYLFINETKSNPKAEYVSEFAEKLKDVFDFLPEHQGKTVVPIFSSLHLPEPIVQLLTKQKIYAMALGGETMELLNYDAVKQQ